MLRENYWHFILICMLIRTDFRHWLRQFHFQ